MVGVQDYADAIKHVPLPAAEREHLAHLLHDAPWSYGGSWVCCSQLHGPRVVVIGDAAHAVAPSLGQGCNAALQDATILDKVTGQRPALQHVCQHMTML